jgi:hypothetical protein
VHNNLLRAWSTAPAAGHALTQLDKKKEVSEDLDVLEIAEDHDGSLRTSKIRKIAEDLDGSLTEDLEDTEDR